MRTETKPVRTRGSWQGRARRAKGHGCGIRRPGGCFVRSDRRHNADHPRTLYETAKAEQREISLDDGSRIHLNSASSVAVRYSAEMRTVELTQRAKVYSTSVTTPSGRSSLLAAGAEVVAIGTRFRVRLADGEVTVTVPRRCCCRVQRRLHHRSDTTGARSHAAVPQRPSHAQRPWRFGG